MHTQYIETGNNRAVFASLFFPQNWRRKHPSSPGSLIPTYLLTAGEMGFGTPGTSWARFKLRGEWAITHTWLVSINRWNTGETTHDRVREKPATDDRREDRRGQGRRGEYVMSSTEKVPPDAITDSHYKSKNVLACFHQVYRNASDLARVQTAVSGNRKLGMTLSVSQSI